MSRATREAIASMASRPARFAGTVTVVTLCLATALSISGLLSSGRAQARLVANRSVPTVVAIGRATGVDGPVGAPLGSEEVRAVLAMANTSGVFVAGASIESDVGGAGLEPTRVPVVDVAGSWPIGGGRLRTSAPTPPGTLVLSDYMANRLGITSIDGAPVHLIIDGRPTPVAGILSAESDVAGLGTGIARVRDLSETVGWSSMLVSVRPGSASVVAELAPRVARPDAPLELSALVQGTSDARALETVISLLTTISSFVALGALVATGWAVAGVASIGVAQRRDEFGLRRAVGAARTDVAVQVLLELAFTAAIAACLAVPVAAGIVLGATALAGWVMAVDASALLRIPMLAIVVAGVCGVLPAWRAASTSPAQAMREL